MINAGKTAYVERNREMIDSISYCIVYYDENYMPCQQKTNSHALTYDKAKSGTKIAYDYAVKKGLMQ